MLGSAPNFCFSAGGRTFYCICFFSFFLFFFFHREISKFPQPSRPIAAKLCHVIGRKFNFISQVPIIRGLSTRKKLEAKNVQN